MQATLLHIAQYSRYYTLQTNSKLEPEVELVEKHFVATHSRDKKGEVVELPFIHSNVSNRWSDDYN